MLLRSVRLAPLLTALPAQADHSWLASVAAGVLTPVDWKPLRVVPRVPLFKGLIRRVEVAQFLPAG